MCFHAFIDHHAVQPHAAYSIIFSCCLSVFLRKSQSQRSQELVHGHVDLGGEFSGHQVGKDHKDAVTQNLLKKDKQMLHIWSLSCATNYSSCPIEFPLQHVCKSKLVMEQRDLSNALCLAVADS